MFFVEKKQEKFFFFSVTNFTTPKQTQPTQDPNFSQETISLLRQIFPTIDLKTICTIFLKFLNLYKNDQIKVLVNSLKELNALKLIYENVGKQAQVAQQAQVAAVQVQPSQPTVQLGALNVATSPLLTQNFPSQQNFIGLLQQQLAIAEICKQRK